MLPFTLSVTPLSSINQGSPQTSSAPPLGNMSTNLSIEDIHLPQTISPWPPAIGWWVLMIIFVVGVYYLYRFLQRRIRRHKQYWGYRKAALRLLELSYQEYKINNESGKTIKNYQATTNAILRILKRTAISTYPQHNVESLYGKEWVNFLNDRTEKKYFHGKIVSLFEDQQYQKPTNNISNNDVDALHHAVKQWIKQHHSPHKVKTQGEEYV